LDEDAVILTAYFGEQHYPGAGSRDDALVGLFARRSVTASVSLRGIEGYGPLDEGAAGRGLPVARDTPLTVVAVDARSRIDAVIDDLARIARPKLVTLERARLLSRPIEPIAVGEMPWEATRLTIFCGRGDRIYQIPAFEEACELLYRRGVAGATVLSGVDGTAEGRRRRSQFLRRGDAPLMVAAVGDGAQIAPLLPELGGLFRHPLMTIAKVQLCKRDGQIISKPETLPADATESAGLQPRAKLTVYTSEAARINGQPAHREFIRLLRSAGVSSATVQRGNWGFHGEHAPHGDRLAQLSRHVPVVTTVIDRMDRIDVAFDVIDKLTPDRGLVIAETVLTPQPARAPSDQGA